MCLRKNAQNRHIQSNTVHKAIPDFSVRMFFFFAKSDRQIVV